jgi:DNA-binding MarR family transcriptional regulator
MEKEMEKKLAVGKKLKNQEPQIPIQRYELRVLQALRRIIRAVDIHSHKLTTRHKITGPQLGCLLAIKESGPVTSAKLAQKVYLSPSTIVGIIDRLEEKKLVQRNRDSKDRRLIHICITEAGEELIAAAPSLLQDTLVDALVGLPESEQISITLTLEKLVDLMEAGHIGAAPILETGPIPPEK